MTTARRLDAPTAANHEDLWGWCDPCARWFYPGQAQDSADPFVCPVCATPAATRAARDAATD